MCGWSFSIVYIIETSLDVIIWFTAACLVVSSNGWIFVYTLYSVICTNLDCFVRREAYLLLQHIYFLHYHWPLSNNMKKNKTTSKRNYCQYWILDSDVVCDYLLFVNNKVVDSNFNFEPSKVFTRKVNNWHWRFRWIGSDR